MIERNHEGYHDPTACRAIRRADRGRRRKKKGHLTYYLREAEGFQETIEHLTARS